MEIPKELPREFFGPLAPLIEDDEITDIDYNGKELWITGTDNQRKQIDPGLTKKWMTRPFIEQFTQRIANLISVQFNRQNPEMEAETGSLRVTVLHESAARSGRCISIRRTPPVIRLSCNKILQEDYCSREVLALLLNCVKAHMNLTFCGTPGAGKTEALKFFASFIPEDERVITIEDTMEIRYGMTNPGKDCVELRINDRTFDYTDAIKASLRLNPRWIMLSEARSREVKYLMESWSTGVCGMTTLHTDDVRNIPDRILNMMENRIDADRLENDVYQAIDVGIMIRKKKNASGKAYRCIDQLCFFLREKGQNRIEMMIAGGTLISRNLPDQVKERFCRAGIEDPWKSEEISPEAATGPAAGADSPEKAVPQKTQDMNEENSGAREKEWERINVRC